jgi:VanZ family protein
LLAWLAFIFFASSDQFSATQTSRFVRPLLHWLFPAWDEPRIKFAHGLVRKIGHFTGYATLAFLAARAFSSSSRDWLRRRWFAFALGLVACYALFDEYRQSFVPTRTASLYDSLLDTAGGVMMLLLYRWRLKRREGFPRR